MTRIGEMFGQARQEGRGVFVPYVTLGDPDLETTRRVVLELEAAGADLIELGVPFSDPLADGPVIQRATERALSQGFTLEKGLTWVADLRRQTQVPLVLFSYYNPLFAYGFERLAAAAKQRGIDGFLITDLSVEEAEGPLQVLRKAGLDSVFLAAPTSTDERIRKIAAYSSGFIYAVSRTGVTGARKSLSDEVQSLIRKIRSHSSPSRRSGVRSLGAGSSPADMVPGRGCRRGKRHRWLYRAEPGAAGAGGTGRRVCAVAEGRILDHGYIRLAKAN